MLKNITFGDSSGEKLRKYTPFTGLWKSFVEKMGWTCLPACH